MYCVMLADTLIVTSSSVILLLSPGYLVVAAPPTVQLELEFQVVEPAFQVKVTADAFWHINNDKILTKQKSNRAFKLFKIKGNCQIVLLIAIQ